MVALAYGDQLDEKLRQAGLMVVELEKQRPGLKHLLTSKAIGDNAMVASMLIAQAQVYWAKRNARRGG